MHVVTSRFRLTKTGYKVITKRGHSYKGLMHLNHVRFDVSNFKSKKMTTLIMKK